VPKHHGAEEVSLPLPYRATEVLHQVWDRVKLAGTAASVRSTTGGRKDTAYIPTTQRAGMHCHIRCSRTGILSYRSH
jgi:hypothetical protein